MAKAAVDKTGRVRYLAIDNKWLYRDGHVVKGHVYREGKWLPVEDLEVQAHTLIKSGSLFEICASKARVKQWFAEGTVAPGDATRHFDMQDVFDEGFADRLHVHGIHCLEDVATELDAIVPGSEFGNENGQPQTMSLVALLTQLNDGSGEKAREQIAAAKAIIRKDQRGANTAALELTEDQVT